MSDTIQRYGLIIDAFSEGMGECHDGEYVLHADHLAAMAAKDAHAGVLQGLVNHLREKCAEYNTALSDEQDRNSELSEMLVSAEQEAAAKDAEIERLNKLCAQRTEMAQRSFNRAEMIDELLRELVAGLERTNWSSWQTTAHFWEQLEAAQAAIAARAGGE